MAEFRFGSDMYLHALWSTSAKKRANRWSSKVCAVVHVPPRVVRVVLVVLVVLAALGAQGCIAVQTHLTADVVVERQGGHDHVVYEAWDSHNVSGIAIGCIVTAWFYGGACWAYLATPFEDQSFESFEAAKRDVARLGGCAHIVSSRIRRVGWDLRQREARLQTLGGRTLRDEDLKRLCTPTSQTPSPTVVPVPTVPAVPTVPTVPTVAPESPRPSPPPRKPEAFDPAEP